MNNPLDPLDPSRPEDLLRRAGGVERAPDPRVWDRISAELDLDVGAEGGGEHEGEPQRARSFGWPGLLAAAAVGALLTWVGAAVLDGTEEVDQAAGNGATVLASAPLTPLPDSGAQPSASGQAQVVTVEEHQRLRVDLEEIPDAGEGYLEVWLLRPDVSGMVTLGALTDDTGEFDLPPGVDLGDYPVVDISLEQVDGDPSHGGQSLVRGQLEGPSAGHTPPRRIH